MKNPLVYLVLFILIISNETIAQNFNSIDKGGFYLYWGYNRSAYTKSDLHLVGEGYDFTMKDMKAEDNWERNPEAYFDITKITVPQFNIRLGYFFKDKWAITLGYDHMKYLMSHEQEVTLDGYIEPGISDLWGGQYNKKKSMTNYDDIHYENSNGLNYIRVELARYFDLFSLGDNNWFRVRAQAAAATGIILSYNDFNFGGQFDRKTISVSGYGLSLHPGLRLEFLDRNSTR